MLVVGVGDDRDNKTSVCHLMWCISKTEEVNLCVSECVCVCVCCLCLHLLLMTNNTKNTLMSGWKQNITSIPAVLMPAQLSVATEATRTPSCRLQQVCFSSQEVTFL